MEFSWYNRSTTRSRFSIYQTFITSIIARIIYQFFNTYYFRAWKCHLLVDVKVVALLYGFGNQLHCKNHGLLSHTTCNHWNPKFIPILFCAKKRDLSHCLVIISIFLFLYFARLPGFSIFHFSFYLMVNVNEWSHNQGLENKIILNSKYIYSIPFVL